MHIGYTLLLLISLISIQGNAQSFNEKDLLGTWHNSFEEQNGDTLVFRPDGYELPKSRGREKMEFQKNDTFVHYQIAPSDGFLKFKGTFTLKMDENELVLFYDDASDDTINHYRILLLSSKKLMLKPIKEK